MRKFIIGVFAIALLGLNTFAQEETKNEETYEFTMQKQVKATPVKDQYRAGTCWSYSGLGFIECELLRLGKPEIDLADLFIVRKTYEDKGIKYVRLHGETIFAAGGAFIDVFNVIRNYGIVPEEVYKGLEYGETNHVHGELDLVLESFVKAVVKNKNRRLSTAWLKAYNAVLDTYLGAIPEKFNHNGVEYTPKSYAASLGLNMDDYVSLTSFTHHPFYEKFILEIPDNWANSFSYNVPLDELTEIMDNSINNGYAIAWGSDVSEKGFKWTKGVAVVPEEDRPDLDGLERAKWESLSKTERDKLLYSFEGPIAEKQITQEMRQASFDNYETTDDHGMVITGIAKDQKGTKYYYVKNSWNTANIYEGYFYASESFVKYKTMNIIVHKNAIPKAIRKKLGIK